VDVNLVEGLVEASDEGLLFRGSRCRTCGETVFPAMLDCPLCAEADAMEPRSIVGRGTVRRAILAERGPAGFPVPYVQSYVQLHDGPVVYSTLDISPTEVDGIVGAEVVATMAPVNTSEGRVNHGWKFRRVSGAT
jgi:uncharacterized OB-fold protein